MTTNTSAQSTKHLNVLVAEDDPADQMLFLMAAEEVDLEMTFDFANDGQELLDALEERTTINNPPDLVILDMRMPRLGGHEVLDHLAARPELKPERVGVFSSSFREQDMKQSLAKGAAWHVVKPSRFEDLVAFITSLADGSPIGEGSLADPSVSDG